MPDPEMPGAVPGEGTGPAAPGAVPGEGTGPAIPGAVPGEGTGPAAPWAAPRSAGERTVITRLLVGFSRELRSAGVPAGTGDVVTYCAAMRQLDPSDLLDLYWAGRTTLVSRREDIGVYDEVFRRFFLGEPGPAAGTPAFQARPAGQAEAVLVVPATEPPTGERQEEARLGLMASDAEALRHKPFAACTPQELAAVRRIMARIRLMPPRRRVRRTRPAVTGRYPDMRRTVRQSMRLHGEPAELAWRRRKVRLRPLILILDVSGSMADYSRSLLQFAYCAKHAAAKVEAFCFGTRLTRITKELNHRRPDAALARAAAAVTDFDGGTRIGACLDAFVKRWGRHGLARGGIVVICSDGLDRGDPAVLAAAMERLARLCHRVVWMNPHKGNSLDFQPNTLGMMIAAPHIDLMLSGHDLSSLEELAMLLPALS